MTNRHCQKISGPGGSRRVLLLLPLVLLLVVLSGASLPALGLPGLVVEHLPDLQFFPYQPLTLDARIDDVLGVIAARCYFRYQPDADYVYVDLEHAGGRDYVASLPAPGGTVRQIEYFFLAVNGAHQVVRSPSFILRQGLPAPAGTSGSSGRGTIEIHAEGAVPASLPRSLAAPAAIKVVPTAAGERYGLLAGVYPASSLPTKGLVAGYFGGFQLDAQGRPMAVKGWAAMPAAGVLGPSTAAAGTTPPAGEASAGPHIAGKWTGVIYEADEVTGRHTRPSPLTAVITEAGSEVTVVTDLETTRPKRLVGTMDAAGDMLLYDEINEDWSTHWGPATMTQIVLADYIYPPTDENHHPPLLVVELWREPPYSFLQAVYKLLLNKVPK